MAAETPLFDVKDWLTNLGLERLIDVFLENDLTSEGLLCALTEETLKTELEIKSFGARTKLLSAIKLFGVVSSGHHLLF